MECWFPMDLIKRILKGDQRAMARAMTLIENGESEARDILKGIFSGTSRALIVGITGSPGTGKSTLVDKLALTYRKMDKTVGVIAVDPTSPFTGGAILADRVRMQALYNDEGVFIRSMATRGHLGGLARTTRDVVSVLDAAGKEIVLIETVGVGQDEVEVVKVADVSVVILVPGMGDDLQAFKAGIMEIGDIFVINKADRPMVEKTEKEVESMLSLAERADRWKPPIVKTIATEAVGTEDLIHEIGRYDQYRKEAPGFAESRKDSIQENLLEILKESLLEDAIQQNGIWDKIRAASEAVRSKRKDPYTATEEILSELKGVV